MASDRVLKVALVVLLLVGLYMWLNRQRSPTYVPFDETPFDTVPPAGSRTATSAPLANPLINVATDLLPKPASPQVLDFGEFAPKALQGQNFLDISQQIGVDTQGSSLRNANYQIRSDPPNPRTNVGPWSNSTIDTDLLRRPLE